MIRTTVPAQTLLIVLDSEQDIFLLRCALEKAGIAQNAHFIRSGKLAVTFLKACLANPGPGYLLPSLVLVDTNLPMMNGHEVLSWVRSQPALTGLPVRMLSTSSVASDISTAEKEDAVGSWVKPLAWPDYMHLALEIKTQLAAACPIPPAMAHAASSSARVIARS